MRVKDVMTRNVLSVSPGDPIERAAKQIVDRHISGVFVTDGRKLVGKVSHSDLLREVFPSHVEFYDDLVHNIDFEQIETRAHDLIERKVSEVADDDVMTVTPDTPVMKLAALMLIRDVHRAAVVGPNDELLGVISRGDIFYHALKRELQKSRYNRAVRPKTRA